MSDAITFKASFPPIQTAIKITGSGDGMRFQMDVPESEMAEAIKLLLMREAVLEVTVRVADGEGKSTGIHKSAKY